MSTTLRIAVVTHYFPSSVMPYQGHSAYQTLRELARMAQVHVFCALPRYPAWLNPRTALPPFDPAWCPGEVDVTYLPYLALPLVSRPLNGFSIARAVLPGVRAYAPDVVLNYVVYPQGFAAVSVGRRLDRPVVLTAIGSDLNRISDRLSAILTRWTLRHADLVTTVSSDLARTAATLGAPAARTRAILNGCDTSVFKPGDRNAAREALGLKRDAQYVLYVGRMDRRKGLVELIDAAAAVHAHRPPLRVLLVGDGSDEPMLRQQIAHRQAEAYVRIVPPCTTSDVARYMASADLITLPSYNEGCPNVVLEALSSGRPVVATNVGGIPELMDDRSGRLVPARNVAALAHALDAVLEAHWSPEAIAARHQRSWNDVACDLHALLEEVVHQAAPL